MRRRPFRAGVLLASLTLACGLAVTALRQKTPKPKAEDKRAPDPALAPVEDRPGLPRVLLIGDSISVGYTRAVREALAGKANVHRPAENCGPTSRGVERLDAWLGPGRWDVIHFNFGLHDLAIVDGRQQVPPETYARNLRAIVARLKRTGATPIWCATTPVPGTGTPLWKASDVIAYNAVAKRIMDENGIRSDDLYGFALPRLGAIQLPADVHFTPAGSTVLARQVAASIEAALASGREK